MLNAKIVLYLIINQCGCDPLRRARRNLRRNRKRRRRRRRIMTTFDVRVS